MRYNNTISVVISAFNEENQISSVIRAVPAWVDRIIIVDDASEDLTRQRILELKDSYISDLLIGDTALYLELCNGEVSKKVDRQLFELYELQSSLLTPCAEILASDNNKIVYVRHLYNAGKGAALATGYSIARKMCVDIIVSIDGDGQMDCDEMHKLVDPITSGQSDYVKGNRLAHPIAPYHIPTIRLVGNSVLSILTKIASGYWGVSDSQTGYTAINKETIRKLDLSSLYTSYGVPNDMLVRLNIAQATIGEVIIRPVYGVGEQSKMKILKTIPRISFLLVKLFFVRLWKKYLIKNLHPLFFLYIMGGVCFFSGVLFSLYNLYELYISHYKPPFGYYFLNLFLLLFGIQFLLFAMWMDMDDNRKLHTLKPV